MKKCHDVSFYESYLIVIMNAFQSFLSDPNMIMTGELVFIQITGFPKQFNRKLICWETSETFCSTFETCTYCKV